MLDTVIQLPNIQGNCIFLRSPYVWPLNMSAVEKQNIVNRWLTGFNINNIDSREKVKFVERQSRDVINEYLAVKVSKVKYIIFAVKTYYLSRRKGSFNLNDIDLHNFTSGIVNHGHREALHELGYTWPQESRDMNSPICLWAEYYWGCPDIPIPDATAFTAKAVYDFYKQNPHISQSSPFWNGSAIIHELLSSYVDINSRAPEESEVYMRTLVESMMPCLPLSTTAIDSTVDMSRRFLYDGYHEHSYADLDIAGSSDYKPDILNPKSLAPLANYLLSSPISNLDLTYILSDWRYIDIRTDLPAQCRYVAPDKLLSFTRDINDTIFNLIVDPIYTNSSARREYRDVHAISIKKNFYEEVEILFYDIGGEICCRVYMDLWLYALTGYQTIVRQGIADDEEHVYYY